MARVQRSRGRFICLLLWLLIATGFVAPVYAEELVRIGVLAKRGHEITLARWQPTADYLTGQIPGFVFEVLPLSFNQVAPAVEAGNVQFVLVNSSMYVQLEQDYGVSRIATLKNRKAGKEFAAFGSVIFSKASQLKLQHIAQLKGKRVAAVDQASLGGWHIALKAMKDANIDIHRDLNTLTFYGIHDRVVEAVLAGNADVGIVRTNLLEQMQSEGKINLIDFSVLPAQSQHLRDFPFLVSSELYPEWPFSRVAYTSDELAEKVASALISMSDNGATQTANIAGWTVPYHYRPVRQLLMALQLPPYEKVNEVTATHLINQYIVWALLVVLAVAIMIAFLVRQYYLGQNLQENQSKLEDYSYRLSLATKAGNFGVWEWPDSQGKLAWDEQMHLMFNIPQATEQPLIQRWLQRIHPEDRAAVEYKLHQKTQPGDHFEMEYRIIWPNAEVKTIKTACVAEPETTTNRSYLVGVSWDITETVRLQEENLRLATLDPLTSALNRRGFAPFANAEFDRSKRYGDKFSVLMIDIDNFKNINDSFGHHFGDQTLRQLVSATNKLLRTSDYLCRWGGEEFVAILLHANATTAVSTAQRLCDELRVTQVNTNNAILNFTVSIGVAEISITDESIEDTIKRADAALYQAKSNGKNRVELIY